MFSAIFGQLREKLMQYIDVQINILKLNLIGQASKAMAGLIFAMICFVFFFCFLFFCGFLLVEVLAESGLSRMQSFMVTTSIYFVLLLVSFLFRKSIIRSFAGVFIRSLTNEDGKE